MVCTGSPLREEVRTEARELLGDVIYDLYGSTEMGWVSIATPGRPAAQARDRRQADVPGIDVRIVDPDGNDVAAGRAR